MLGAATNALALDLELKDVSVKTTGQGVGKVFNLWGNGYVGEWIQFPKDGEYAFGVAAVGIPAWGIWPIMRLSIDTEYVGEVRVGKGELAVYPFQATVKAGVHLVAVSFMNDYWDGQRDRNLVLLRMRIGPVEETAPQPTKGVAPAQWKGPGEDAPFEDFTEKAGLTFGKEGKAADTSGGTFTDFDKDGHVDLVMAGALLRNTGNGRFEKVGKVPGGICAVWGDIDGDGDLDLFIGGNRDRDFLYRNDGFDDPPKAPRFTDVSKAAGIKDTYASRGAAFGDFDNDGDLDLYVVNYEYDEKMGVGHPDFLYRNDGTDPKTKMPKFTNVLAEVGMEPAGGPRVGTSAMWCDFNGDGHLDLYVTNYRLQDNFLWRNNGKGKGGKWSFTDIAGKLDVAKGGTRRFAHGTGLAWVDYDNDGDFDLFVSNLKHSSKHPQFAGQNASVLYRNDKGKFTDVTGEMEFPTDPTDELDDVCPTFFDADNDGDLDLYIGGSAQGGSSIYTANDGEQYHSTFYWNEGGIFKRALYKSIEIEDSWGVCSADVDGDGFVDLLVGSGTWSIKDVFKGQSLRPPGDRWSSETGRVRLLRNTLKERFPDHRWVKIRLEGKRNRFGIGGVIRVKLDDGRTLMRLVSSSTTSEGSSGEPIVQHVGIGKAKILSVSVTWPGTGRTLQYKKPAGKDRFEPNSLVVLKEK
jgi:hypothetical protein